MVKTRTQTVGYRHINERYEGNSPENEIEDKLVSGEVEMHENSNSGTLAEQRKTRH